jgi:hypothetical protein
MLADGVSAMMIADYHVDDDGRCMGGLSVAVVKI